MTNSEKFYFQARFCLNLLHDLINKGYKKEILARKFIKQVEDAGFSVFEAHLTLTTLFDITSLALNKEKVENVANLNWDTYHGETMVKLDYNYAKKPSKIPYFKEWLNVEDCKTAFLNDNAQGWIKRLRNAFLHGQFEPDYSTVLRDYGSINIVQGGPAKTSLKMKVLSAGLNEFIEDNFRNVYDEQCGVMDEYSYIGYPEDFHISNIEDLRQYLSEIIYTSCKLDFDNYTYDGSNLVSKTDGRKQKINVQQNTTFEDSTGINLPDYLVKTDSVSKLKPSQVDMLARIIDKNAKQIYSSKGQKKIIHKYFCNYVDSFKIVNVQLHNLVHIANYILFQAKMGYPENLNYDYCMYLIDKYKDNLEETFTMLNLNIFMYRHQNHDLTGMNYENLHCDKVFATADGNEIAERAKKIMAGNDTISATQAQNMAYIETVRNALMHGNVKFLKAFDESTQQVEHLIKFVDCYTDKSGVTTQVSVISNPNNLKHMFDWADENFVLNNFEN